MYDAGWRMERQQTPPSLHLSVMPHHEEVVDKILMDLRASVYAVKTKGYQAVKIKGSSAFYGVAAHLPDRSLLSDFIRKLYGEIYRLPPEDLRRKRLASVIEEDGEEEEEDGEEAA